MKTVNITNISITYPVHSSYPVILATQLLEKWLNKQVSTQSQIRNSGLHGKFLIMVGTLEQPEIHALVHQHSLPDKIRADGYIIALINDLLLIYSQIPRGVIYAVGYELPLRSQIIDEQLQLNFDLVVEEPDDDMRAWCAWARDYSFMLNAATHYRLNMYWMETQVSSEVLLLNEAGLHPFIQPHEIDIKTRRKSTDEGIALGKSIGLEVFIGGLNTIWVLPQYLFEALTAIYPETIASSFKGGSDWPPYEWQDRPQLCPSSPITKCLYSSIVEEFITVHPDADGIAIGVGYDGYPLGCGCNLCSNYSYDERFHDQIMLVYDVVVKKYGKKLWLWTWVVGGASSIPGYNHYYHWVKDFAEANPQSVIISSFATEGDFNITHRLNPVIGKRGPQDLGNVLIWPEYRGDGIVPAWLIDWMATALPAYRLQGARGFMGVDTTPLDRERDIIQAAEIYAFGEFTWDAKKTAEDVALEYCRRTFGEKAAPLIANALRKSSEVIAKTLYLPAGPRFSGHSHIENDLRIFWDVYTLYDSAPFFLSEEQRHQIFQAGPPYQPKIEAAIPGLAFTDENVTSVAQGKNEAVMGAEWMISQVEIARPFLHPEVYEQLKTRFSWLKDYARLFRGLAWAVFHLRMGRIPDGNQVIVGAEEMNAAIHDLPQTGLPLPYNLHPEFGGFPWMITPPQELINSLKAAGELLINGINGQTIGIFGSEEAIAALDSIYVPYQKLTSLECDLTAYQVLILGPASITIFESQGKKLTNYVQQGGKIVFYNPSENWEALPIDWLPGKVKTWVCNHPKVTVTQPTHPIVQGYKDLRAQPITRFQATSAQVLEAARYSPFIKSFVAVSNEWKTLTFPPVLAETSLGKGKLLIDLIPENRTVLLRTLAYLTQ